MNETCRLRRGEGYGVCADAVVSKCALTGEKEEAPGFPETSQRIQLCCDGFCIR